MNALKPASLVVLAAFAGPLLACALAPRAGDAVRMAEESALIVWDAERKTQHFIRRAQFETNAKDFGFLVPTPTRPALSEVPDRIFAQLEGITRPPPTRSERERQLTRDVAVASAAPRPAVTVVQQVTVAGLDAAVLDANDAKALDAWLKKNGYSSSPELTEWFKPYLQQKWLITAFKIAKGKDGVARAKTSAVRMSFHTERPFFPYSEPATKSPMPRALEVYFVSSERVEARTAAKGSWSGQTLWAKPLDGLHRLQILDDAKLPSNGAPAKAWLTRFLDTAAPRPGTDDLYFTRAFSQAEVVDTDGLQREMDRKRWQASAPPASRYSPPPSPPLAGGELATLIRQAHELELAGRVPEAVRVYRRAARAGSGPAARRLGEIFDRGAPGVARDYEEALLWLERARELGEPVPLAAPR